MGLSVCAARAMTPPRRMLCNRVLSLFALCRLALYRNRKNTTLTISNELESVKVNLIMVSFLVANHVTKVSIKVLMTDVKLCCAFKISELHETIQNLNSVLAFQTPALCKAKALNESQHLNDQATLAVNYILSIRFQN